MRGDLARGDKVKRDRVSRAMENVKKLTDKISANQLFQCYLRSREAVSNYS